MSRLDEIAKQGKPPLGAESGSKLWNEQPIGGTEISLRGERNAISKITFAELYVFIFKVMLASAAVLAPFVIIYLVLTNK